MRMRKRRRRRLLCFDLLEETVGWWSVEVVRRFTSGVNSWTLLRACGYNRAYKHAQRPRLAGNLLIGDDWTKNDWNSFPAHPADIPLPPDPPIITGFQEISIDYAHCDSLLVSKVDRISCNYTFLFRRRA